MKVVFDTNVLISSTLWNGSVSQKLLFKIILADSEIFSSSEILAEYSDVLKRDFGYSDEELVGLIQKVLSFVTLVKPTVKFQIVKEDSDDNKIIECAVASSSSYIITYDKHLLQIVDFNNIKILRPEEALKLV